MVAIGARGLFVRGRGQTGGVQVSRPTIEFSQLAAQSKGSKGGAMRERDDQLEKFVLRERTRLPSRKASLWLRATLIALLALLVAGSAFLILS